MNNVGYDFRPFFDVRGLKYTSLAQAQVLAHIASGQASKGAVSTGFYALNNYPQASILQGVQRIPLDGAFLLSTMLDIHFCIRQVAVAIH